MPFGSVNDSGSNYTLCSIKGAKVRNKISSIYGLFRKIYEKRIYFRTIGEMKVFPRISAFISWKHLG